MKLNNLYDIISDGWKYTILLKIKIPQLKDVIHQIFAEV